MDLLERPRMPTVEDEMRAVRQSNRYRVCADDWSELLRDWALAKHKEEIAATLGEPDTSANTLADTARQLSTPGLYGARPMMRHGGEQVGLVAIDGPLDQAGWATKMQLVQYLTLGVGDWLGRFGVARGRLTFRLVRPFNVWLRTDPADASVILELWELQTFRVGESWRHCWEVFDISASPSHRIHLARNANTPAGAVVGELGEDVTTRVLGEEHAGAYPWVAADGTPVIPYGHWQEVDSGQTWNEMHRRDAYIGALNAALNWTYVGRNAVLSTGTNVITANLLPAGYSTIQTGGHGVGGQQLAAKVITPGAIDYHSVDGDKTPYVWQVAEGVNLGPLLDFADRYELKQLLRWGLNPSDITRTAANPASAASLMVSDEGKQRFSRQIEPVARRNDLAALRIAAIVCRAGGIGDFPEDGYTIQYPSIRPTAQQQQARRDDMAWQIEQGTMSEVDVYMELNPGTSEEDAIAALRKVQRQRAEIRAVDPEPPAPQPPTP